MRLFRILFESNNLDFSCVSSNLNTISLEKITIYPNPNEGDFQLTNNNLGNLSGFLIITDMTGKIVYKKTNFTLPGFTKKSINIKNLSTGSYILSIRGKENHGVKRLIISKWNIYGTPIFNLKKRVSKSYNIGDLNLLLITKESSFRKSSLNDIEILFRNQPNPVRPEYTGLIGIKGLAENAEVKITDITGNLVYETFSEGTTATWDGNSLNGKRVQTGVYIVFSSSSDGTQKEVAKILFIN